jgi:3'(2'), 5'-bisphosphate nucleotidase
MSEVNLLDLAGSAIAATLYAAQPIRRFAQASNARLKLDGTVVTDADFAAQECIISTLRKVSKHIAIIGEEEEAKEELRPSVDQPLDRRILQLAHQELRNRYYKKGGCPLAQGDLPEEIGEQGESSSVDDIPDDDAPEYLVDADRVRVFVDPLDGTKSYANGEYDVVSILIAIILDNRPYFGVITKPFGYKGHRSVLDTECVVLYGGDLIRGVYFGGIEKPCQVVPNNDMPRAVISSSRSKGVVQDFCDYLASVHMVHPEPLQVSGAGEKSLRLIVGTMDETLWFFPKEGTSRWDVAASDALLRAMGGKLTDKYGNELDYSKSREDSENTEGIIASNNAALHEECIRLFNDGKWNAPSADDDHHD